MNAFLWTMLGVFTLDAIGRIVWLATGKFPPRTPGMTAVDLVLNVGFAVWVIHLLMRQSL